MNSSKMRLFLRYRLTPCRCDSRTRTRTVACTRSFRMRLSRSDIVARTRPAAIGTEDLRPWRKVARYGANPVNGGYAFDFRAASLGIDAGMHTTPFGSCAACCGIANSQWQALLLLTTTVRPLVASWRLPTWQNDDPRPVPRPQLCWAPEFNSPVGLLRWTSCSSDEGVLQRPRTITCPAAVTMPPMLDGWRL